jgi:hypothetical protein
MNSQHRERTSLILAKHGGPAAAVWFGRLAKIVGLPLLAAATLLTVSTAVQSGAPQLSPIQLSPEKRQLIGVQFATVEQKELKDSIQTTALVEADEQKQGYVQTRFADWIRNVFVNQTYQFVRRGQPLFTIYSPDLVSAEQEYLLALDTTCDLRRSDV